ncbi:hypothetical protein JCM1841_000504 [Sporobolomyces salmonicolor]
MTSIESLVSAHRTTLTDLYTSLTSSPTPLVEAHLSELSALVAAKVDEQRFAAEAEVAVAEKRLADGWKRVNDWQAALGEPTKEARTKGDGPLLKLAEDVEAVIEGMKGRMQERGTLIVGLQRSLAELREIVGRDWLQVELEDVEKGWEELDLRLERMSGLEREVMRCEAEIAHRRDTLNANANEIFALRNELGIHQDTTPSDNPSSSAADPLDEEVLWHLGVGEARQPRKEIIPTMENMLRIEAKRKWLEEEKDSRNNFIQATYDKLYPLWTMLGVSEDEMDAFVNRWMGSTQDVVNAYQNELARMNALKRSNLSTFIQREREALTALWDTLYLSHPQRLAQFPAYAISVEPTRVWNAAHGCEDELVSDNVSEELLVAHERERERLEKDVEEARPVLERLTKYFEVVEKMKALEAAAADPSRLTSRGSSARLLQEERDRKRVQKEKPKLEAELRSLIPQWEAANNRPFLVNGVSFIDGLDQQQRAEELEKENKKRAKLGASTSSSSHAPARPLKPQQTGTSSHSVAPLKRQMTGASTRSTSSSSSHPPAKRQTPMATGSSTASHPPRPKSVLGDANSRSQPHGPIKAQMTGPGRARAGTLSASVSASTPGGGMRIPAGWGAGAGPSAAGAGMSAGGAGAGYLAAQQTGQLQKSGLLGTLIPDLFRPRVFLQAEFPRSGAAVQLGNEVSPEAAKEEPRVQFVAEDPAATSEALYTLVVVDPDAPSRSAPNASPFLHLVLPGLKPPSLDRLAATGETGDVAAAEGSMVEKTQAAWVEWTGPAPPEGAGPHRYVYLLYLQPPPAAGSVFLPGRSPSISTPEARQNFDLDAFVEDHELVLVGANFMLASRPGLFDLRRSSPL